MSRQQLKFGGVGERIGAQMTRTQAVAVEESRAEEAYQPNQYARDPSVRGSANGASVRSEAEIALADSFWIPPSCFGRRRPLTL